MTFASVKDRTDIEAEKSWADRNVARTIHDFIANAKDQHGHRPAVSFQLTSDPSDKGETLTWSELYGKVCQTANLLRSLGIGPNDTVAFLLPNSNETVFTLLGGMVAGVVNPINPLLEPEQISAILRETNAKVLVTLRSFPKTDIAQKAAEAVKHAPNVHTVLEIDLLRYLTPPKSWIVPLIRPKAPDYAHADVMNFTKAIARQNRTLDFEDVKEDRVAAYFHTGGTTGMPKVAQHKYSGMVYQGWLGARLLFDEQDTVICPLPLFHVFAVHPILMSMIASGAHVVFPTPAGYRGEGVFDNFWKLVEKWQVTFMITVPTAVSALMQRKVDADISTLKTAFSGSAPMPLELFRRFETACGVTICEGYGLTEATCLVSINPPAGEKRVGSVGIPFPYTEVKILRSTADGPVECAPDEVGEICVANPGVFAGSTYTEADKNRDLFHHDIYLRTGDLGRLDPDGYLWITGRAKDLIIRGGHNIDPAEIEEALLTHQAVAFAGAIGQPDPHSGEVPCAYVELVSGAEVSVEELMEHARKHIHERAAYPKHLEIMPELPKTAVGKIFKPDLRKMAIARIYSAALAETGCHVAEVVDDKKRGLVARVQKGANGADPRVAEILASHTRPWEWID